jgi:ABC-type amino acid transport substrate-binding protein
VPARAMELRFSVSIYLFRAIFAALGPGFAARVLADTLDNIGQADRLRSPTERPRCRSPRSASMENRSATRLISAAHRCCGKAATDLSELAVRYVPVTAENRMTKLEKGDIDIECGSTSRTLWRQARVDFILLTFNTGIEILVHLRSKIDDLSGLGARRSPCCPARLRMMS